ncbi:cell division protein ZapE [Candidatus Thalassolituus haligoni]|uniref:cell division protein ZapE n=1 Tax=Candidatus Thalassolituus haligoni TaxID=3100113 RepID=UPI0035171791|tara:strand:- start:1115 stop:2215 length:1101 start_codon:yes stop_codon:yes gene_type:complete
MTMPHSLLAWFSDRKIQLDVGQQRAAEALEQLQQQAVHGKRNLSFIRRQRLVGAYLWGEPGRGKTLLMDALFQQFPLAAKRIHYHAFLRDLHRGMANSGGKNDYLVTLAHQVASQCRLFCLDEFHLHDIADVILLERFLAVLIKQRVVIVLTSNYPPQELLPDPDLHHRALGAIAMIEKHLRVLHLDHDQDYRYREAALVPNYINLLDQAADDWLLNRLAEWGHALRLNDAESATVPLRGRGLPVRALDESCVWFDMAAICEGPRSHLDYLELAERWSTVVISDIQTRHLWRADTLRRFIWLVDVLYEHKHKLLLSSERPIQEMLADPALAADTLRSLSRLMEMQSPSFQSGIRQRAAAGLLEPQD